MPDKDPATWEGIAAGLGAALSLISTWAWKHTHGVIKSKADAHVVSNIEKDVRTKADASTVSSLSTAVQDKASSAQLIEVTSTLNRMCKEHREDSQRIFDQISDVMSEHQKFTEKALEELGKRPTREECSRQRCGDFRKA